MSLVNTRQRDRRPTPMCAGLPHRPPSPNSKRHALGQQDSLSPAERHTSASLWVEDLDRQGLAAGLALARNSSAIQALAQVQPEIKRIVSSQAQIRDLLEGDFQRLKAIATGAGSLQATNPFVEAQRERYERLAELVNPSRQLLENLEVSTRAMRGMAEATARAMRQMTASHSQVLQRAALGINCEAARRAAAFNSLHIPARIHALPASAPPEPHPRQETSSGRASGDQPKPQLRNSSLLIPSPERENAVGTQREQLNEEARTQNLLSTLNRFVESKEISSDVKEGLTSIITWFKFNQHLSDSEEGRKLNILIKAFLRYQHGLGTPPEFHHLLSSGLLVPQSSEPPEIPELEPRIYTSKEVAKALNYNEASIRKLAGAAWKDGGEPKVLRKGSEWYVVGRGSSDGGRKCGWQFQKRCPATTQQS